MSRDDRQPPMSWPRRVRFDGGAGECYDPETVRTKGVETDTEGVTHLEPSTPPAWEPTPGSVPIMDAGWYDG